MALNLQLLNSLRPSPGQHHSSYIFNSSSRLVSSQHSDTGTEKRQGFKASQTNRSWHGPHDEKCGPLSLVSGVLKQIKRL